MSSRVLLVEDDPSIARFVAMALEEVPVELVVCTSVATALDALRAQPVRLVVTDLMLPGESGLSLLQALQDQPALRREALLVVFSAGVTTDIRQQLDALDVWRILSKPASVAALEACVRDALQLNTGAERMSGGTDVDLMAEERLAISSHFAGDAALFRAYRDSCLKQFSADRLAGDQAMALHDASAMRRLAHSLATVLLTLGYEEASTLARALEAAAEKADAQAMAEGWATLSMWLTAKGDS
jgi:DNA-binding NtrC family response regulator